MVMRQNKLIFAPLFAVTFLISACDEGDIVEKEVSYAQGGYNVTLHCKLTGLGEWNGGYNVVIAAFDDKDKDYDLGELRIGADCEGKDTTIVWENINHIATSIELCITDRLRRRSVTFHKEMLPDDGNTLNIDVGTLNVGLRYSVEALFAYDRRCTGCHGDGNFGGLRLNSENAYNNLVGVPAHRAEFAGAKRVEPGDPEHSALYQMLDPNDERGKSVTMFNHKSAYGDELSQGAALSVIGKWISEVEN